MDFTTLIGVALGVSCILVGQMLEGGHAGSIVQTTAFLIVVGGTLGAVVAQFPGDELRRGLREAGRVFARRAAPPEPTIKRIVDLARKSRREGLLVLEQELKRTSDPFLRQALATLVDGHDTPAIRAILERVIDQEDEYREPGAQLFEAAGGYAPTLGILGAVLGLIHVMENLADPSKLGAGIAVAFVATVYGVGSANLVFLPCAEKLRMKLRAEARRKEMILEGVCAIQEGANPALIEKRLYSFVEGGHSGRKTPARRPVAPRAAKKQR